MTEPSENTDQDLKLENAIKSAAALKGLIRYETLDGVLHILRASQTLGTVERDSSGQFTATSFGQSVRSSSHDRESVAIDWIFSAHKINNNNQ